MMRYSNLELWQFIQKHPDFTNFSGSDNDLRNWKKENPGLSINLDKGQWYHHNAGKGGVLFELATSLNVLPENSKKIPTPNEIWTKSKRNDEAVKLYFTKGRNIPEQNFADILDLFREDH